MFRAKKDSILPGLLQLSGLRCRISNRALRFYMSVPSPDLAATARLAVTHPERCGGRRRRWQPGSSQVGDGVQCD